MNVAELPAVGAAIERLPGPVRDAVGLGIEAVRPILDLEVAEARADELALAAARVSSVTDTEMWTDVTRAVGKQQEDELERWRQVIAVLDHVAEDSADRDVDALARVLGLHEDLHTFEATDKFMRDDASVLRLGPPSKVAMVADSRLAPWARRLASPSGLPPLPQRDVVVDQISTATGAGHWVSHDDAPGVLLGDGTYITSVDGIVVRRQAVDGDVGRLVARRFVSRKAPLLAPHAVAGLAAACAARAAHGPEDPAELAGRLALGVPQAPSSATATASGVRQHVRSLRSVGRVADAIGPARDLALLSYAVHLWTERVADHRTDNAHIDVGRVRWCTLADRPMFWLPLWSDDPYTVGGADRPWTSDIPAAAADWHATAPALRLDPDWSARIVLDPADPMLLCVDPSGTWWTLDVNYEALILARRSHLREWFEALRVLMSSDADADVVDDVPDPLDQQTVLPRHVGEAGD